MSAGQVLFKLSAKAVDASQAKDSVWAYINVFLIAGMCLYVALSFVWVWLLRFVPLSKAYPFVALAFVFTPIFAHYFFQEALTLRYFLAVALVTVGIALMSYS